MANADLANELDEVKLKSGVRRESNAIDPLIYPKGSFKLSNENLTKTNTEKKNLVVRQSTFLAVGAVGIFAAFSGVTNLQSSLNFEESLGTSSLAICYATTIVLNATIVPILLQILGAKFLLLMSDFAFIVYTFANLYPVKYTLYPAAVILGIGEAFVWPAISMFNAQFGILQATYIYEENSQKIVKTDTKFVELIWKRTRWFTGRFFAIFAVHQIAGNLVAYIILVFDYDEPKNNVTTANNNTSDIFTDVKTSYCGAKDCYEYESNADMKSQNSARDNLDVGNSLLRILLFVGYGLVQILSLIFHKFFLKESHAQENKDSKLRPSFREIGNFQLKIFHHMTSALQILLAPLNIYSGMMMGYIFGDVTRSFISCPLGVEKVGLAMAIFGVAATLGSALFQQLSPLLGRNFFVALAFVIETSLLVFCLLWTPLESKAWQIYITVALFGLPDSVRQAALVATYPEYFAKNKSVAFSMMSLLSSTGFTIMFALGTSICVYTKISILISVLSFSILCYAVAEIYFHKMVKQAKSSRNTLKSEYVEDSIA